MIKINMGTLQLELPK